MIVAIISFILLALGSFMIYVGIKEHDETVGGLGFILIFISILLLTVWTFRVELITPKNLLVIKGGKHIYLESSELDSISENFRFIEVSKEKIKIRKEYGFFTNKLNSKFIVEGEE